MIPKEYAQHERFIATPGPVNEFSIARYEDLRGIPKRVFGIHLHNAVAAGYQFPSRQDLFYVSDGLWAKQEAETLASLSRETKDSARPVVSLGEGIGNTSWYLAKALGPTVPIIAVESNPRTYEAAKHNLKKAYLARQVTCLNTDAAWFLADAKKRGERYRAIFMDLDWTGNSYVDTYANLADLNPDLELLLNPATERASVVAFRVPYSFQLNALRDFGKAFGRNTQVHKHGFEGDPPEYSIHTVFLTEDKPETFFIDSTVIWTKVPPQRKISTRLNTDHF